MNTSVDGPGSDSVPMSERILAEFAKADARMAAVYGVNEEYALETVLGTRMYEGRVNETSMNRLTGAVTKVASIKTQDSPSNIAWTHSGLENKLCNYPPEMTYQDNPDRKDAEGKRATLIKFLADRKENPDYQRKSDATNQHKRPGYAAIKKLATAVQGGDKDVIEITKDGKTLNNSPNYWKFRKNLPVKGPEMGSTANGAPDDD